MLAPSRTDWRWDRACDASQYADSVAWAQVESQDEVVQRAYLFKRAIDNGLDTGRWPDLEAAYKLWLDLPSDKLFIEGLILGKRGFDKIASDVGCDTADVKAYHDVFFDVTSMLDKPGWVVARLFQGGLYAPVSSRDRVGLMHRLAWLSGPEVFHSYYTGVYDIAVRDAVRMRTHDMIAKLSLLSAMCMSGRGDLDVELLKVQVELAKVQTQEVLGKMGEADTETAKAVMGFLSSFEMKVYDPTDEKNLTLPAREPRAHEYFQKPLPAPASP